MFLINKALIYPHAMSLPYSYCESTSGISEKQGTSGHHLQGHCIRLICACL